MLLIPCPWCGSRDEREFDYGGQHVDYPELNQAGDLPQDAWHKAVHLRDNSRGEIRELWYHRSGCERWISVMRNTLTHQFCDTSNSRQGEGVGDDDAA